MSNLRQVCSPSVLHVSRQYVVDKWKPCVYTGVCMNLVIMSYGWKNNFNPVITYRLIYPQVPMCISKVKMSVDGYSIPFLFVENFSLFMRNKIDQRKNVIKLLNNELLWKPSVSKHSTSDL